MSNNDDHRAAVKKFYVDPAAWINSGKGGVDMQMLDLTMIKNKNVLDLGCHYPTIELMYGFLAENWVAIDILPEVIERCRQLCSFVKFIEMNMTSLKFIDNFFHTIFDFSSGDQLPEEDYDLVIREAYRVLIPGGYFLVAYSAFEYFKIKETNNCGYSRMYTVKQIEEKLTKVGFLDVTHYPNQAGRAGIRVQK